ncbi:MAG: hypothetical protein FGM52_04560 [Mycobacterium sp.]|nr:hypothetical protein [Mycobacterium sp.]
MAAEGITKNILSVAAALTAGYLVWLGGVSLIILVAPVSLWAVGAVVHLVAITAASLAVSRRHHAATAAIYAPVLPIIASVYLLLCLPR